LSFLAPLFLAGLTALAIPVVIHLINRERREVVQFPSLMFLQRIPYRSVRRQKLRHILLLVMRCLALAILVTAFARPFIRRDAPMRSAGAGAREVVVLVDRSYSMGLGDHWSRAQNAARRSVANLTPTDRATIVSFDNQASAVTPPTSNVATLNAAVDALHPGSEGTRYAPPLKLASQILAGSNLPRREVVLISDFQRLGWTLRDEIAFPPGTTITNVDVTGGDTLSANAAVANVNIQRSEGERDRATIAARLTNTGVAALDGVDATLELNGRIAETKRVTIPAHGATQVRFAPIAIPSGTSAGLVRFGATNAKADQLAADNRYYFTIAPDAGVSVLLVEPSNPRANQSLYLTRALAIGDRPSFRVDVRKTGGLAPADLDDRSLIIFDEVPPPTGDGARRLREFLDGGGGVLVVAGDQLPVSAWMGEWASALPATIGPVVDRSGEAGGTLAWTDYDHPVFDVFNAPRSGDFATARFLRYRRLTVRSDSATRAAAAAADTTTVSHILARFDDGAPALVERRAGRGKVLLWASTLDSYWNDLTLQPVFLPFIHQLAKYAGRYSGARASFAAGEVLDLSRHGELTSNLTNRSGAVVVEAPSGEKTRLGSAAEGLVPLHEQGFYEVRAEGAARGMGRRLAVNLDPAEANLARIDPEELKASVLASAGGSATGSATADAPTREDTERRQTIWWYLLALAGILLATETLMSNRLSRRSA
jgi:Mg-chelatase subunit ChlD